MSLFGFPPTGMAAIGIIIALIIPKLFPVTKQHFQIMREAYVIENEINPPSRLPRSFYHIYVMVTSIIIVYLINLPSMEFEERIVQMPSNISHDEIMTIYSDVCNHSGNYEHNICNLWWKAFILFLMMGQVVQYFSY